MTTDRPSLRTLSLKDRYRSDADDVVRDFYLPAFQVAATYSRAVGYFTSTSMALYSRGIETFAKRGGMMRLVASPYLTEDDIADIERGYDLRDMVARATLRELDRDAPNLVLDGLGVLGRLIAEGRLDIKIAFVEALGRVGIYHEKLGVFRDTYGDLLAFTGSSNETLGGLAANFESVDVFRGWLPADGKRAVRYEEDFERLWSNSTPNLTVEAFPDVARERLIALGHDRPYRPLAGRDTALIPSHADEPAPTVLRLPETLLVRDYQKKAVTNWLTAQGRGILKMATGTGKTKTALIAATQLCKAIQQREETLVMVVVAPYQHLVDQWIGEIEAFGVRPVGVYESSSAWIPKVENQMTEARLGQRPVVALVATNASFAGDRFQSVLSRVSGQQRLLLIADEAHNLGSATYRSALPRNATYRLALSATPERWFDDEGTDALTDYFGQKVLEISLDDAINTYHALCHYDYHPRLVELDDPEMALYLDLTARIAKCFAAGQRVEDEGQDSQLGRLLRDRANVLGHAAGKLAVLRQDMEVNRESWYQLVYCAEGGRPTDGVNQVDEAMVMIGRDLGLSAHRYVADTPRQERRLLLRRFGTGQDLRVLVSMRCLDEGVDIPDARTGYLLASSSNPRQFIQRRGRLLRLAEGKVKADIYDYLAVPADGVPLNFDVERSLLIRELQRADEFGKLSDNYGATLDTLRPVKQRYQLMDI